MPAERLLGEVLMFEIDKSSYVPAYQQVKNGILRAIRAGKFLPGDRIPSVREIVRETGLAYLTVSKAIGELSREGALVSKKGRGTFVQGGHQAAPGAGALQIGVLGPAAIDSLYTPFSYETLLGMNSGAAQMNVRLNHLPLADFVNGVAVPDLDGVVVMNADSVQDKARLCMDRLPCVMVRNPRTCEGANYIEADDYQATVNAIEHLVAFGHERIAFSKHDQTCPIYADRYRAYCDVLAAHGLPFCESLVVAGSQYIEVGYGNLKQLLAQKSRPTAFFAGSDVEAVGAIRAAREAGCRIPEDISIVGFLNLAVFANHDPRLTTVSVPMKRMGYEAVCALARIIRGECACPVRMVLDAELVVGETTGPASRDETERRGGSHE